MMRVRRVAIVAPFFGADLSAPGPRLAYAIAQTLCARNNHVEVLSTCARGPSDDWSANYYRPGIDRSEPFAVRRFAADGRDRAQYEQAEAVFADLAMRPNWTQETVSRDHERAIVEDGIVSADLVAYVRSAAWTYDAFLFLSYRDSITFGALPAVADRAILMPGLRREPFAVSDSTRKLMRSARGLVFTSEDEYALAVSLYGPSIVTKSREVGPIVHTPAQPSPLERIGGFDLGRRYVAAFADHPTPYAIEPVIAAFGRHRAALADSPLRLFVGGITLWEHAPGVRAIAQLSAAEREAVVTRAAAIVHVDRSDPVASAAVEGLAGEVAAIVGEGGTPRLARAIADANAGWLVNADNDLAGIFAQVSGTEPADLARRGSHGPDALAQLGRAGWAERIEAIVDGLQAVEDFRTREQALAQIAYLYPLVRQMRADIGAMQASRFWRLRDAWFGLKDRLGFGAGDTLRRYDEVADLATLGAIGDPYFIWAEQHRLRADDINDIVATIRFLPARPTFALTLVLAAQTPPALLEARLDSLLGQLYTPWRVNLCIPAEDLALREIAESYAARDPRITIDIEPIDGDFVGSIDAGDLLERDAFYRIALILNTRPATDIVYSDLDFLDDNGIRSSPFFKPDWSPESVLGRNLFVGLTLIRGSLFRAAGGLRAGLDGAAWYDAALRTSERTERIEHLARVVLHRRRRDGERDAEAERRVVSDALVRRGERATVETVGAEHLAYRLVRYVPRTDVRITIIVPTRDRADLLERCIASIFDLSTYGNFDVLVVDNGSTKAETREVFARWSLRRPSAFRVLHEPSPFNFAALNNKAVAQTDADFIVFLNNDTVVISPDWLESLLSYAQRPWIGAAGALLSYPDDTVQHAGVVLGILGLAGHAHRHFPLGAAGYFGALSTVTNYSAVTGACMMVDRLRFLAVDGFDERFAVAWNDVDLCLKLRERGLRNVYVPHAKLYHFESKTRGGDDTPAKVARAMSEQRAMREKWPGYVQRDPAYNPHLSVDSEDFGLRL